MSFIKFGTIANAQITVSSTVINLKTQLAGDGNIKELRKGDVVIVRVNNGQPIRYCVDGNVPTATLGNMTSGGFSVQGQFIEDVNLILDTNATADSEVFITVGKDTVGVNQILNL